MQGGFKSFFSKASLSEIRKRQSDKLCLFLLTFFLPCHIVCLLGLQVSVPYGTAEHRNGVRFPGEPVAVMAECFFTRREQAIRSSCSLVTHWRFSAGKGKKRVQFHDRIGNGTVAPKPKDLPGGPYKKPRVLGFLCGNQGGVRCLDPRPKRAKQRVSAECLLMRSA